MLTTPAAAPPGRPLAVLGPSSPRTAAAVRVCRQILSPPPRDYPIPDSPAALAAACVGLAADAPAAILVLDFGQGGRDAVLCCFDAILDLPASIPVVAVAVADGPRGYRPTAVIGLRVADWLTALSEARA